MAPEAQIPSRADKPTIEPTPAPVPAEEAEETDTFKLDSDAESEATDSSTYFEAPRLFNPQNAQDRTARRHSTSKPSVDVKNAVYRQSTNESSSQASFRAAKTQAEIDAQGWEAVPVSR